mmetsp:Transcript_13854/g.33557  ORF Transcript_13854/g.33557 Transcript_13854/m.33557 type:complete len:112 (+) Transcript_13854:232-567(+)
MLKRKKLRWNTVTVCLKKSCLKNYLSGLKQVENLLHWLREEIKYNLLCDTEDVRQAYQFAHVSVSINIFLLLEQRVGSACGGSYKIMLIKIRIKFLFGAYFEREGNLRSKK